MMAKQAKLQQISQLLVDSGMAQLPALDSSIKASKVLTETPELMAHFLNRTSYGFTSAELDVAQSMGLNDYLEYQLAWDAFDTGVIDNLLHQVFDSLQMNYRELIERARTDTDFDPGFEVIAATLVRAAYQPNQLYETMVEFWSNHFNVTIFD